MNAIIPINISALRVSANDNSNTVGDFSGRMIQFEETPWIDSSGTSWKEEPFAGKSIFRGLENNPAEVLHPGIHLHWALPAYFSRGKQGKEGGAVEFPHAPNRWLVIRYIRKFDQVAGSYSSVQEKAWVVESDYISDRPDYQEKRSGIPVPLPAKQQYEKQTFRYMGRVVDLEKWDPASAAASDYLPSYKDQNNHPYYLTSMGFVGPHFSSYYPECAPVFGFWDGFEDLDEVSQAITKNQSIKFKVSYQVIGWINDTNKDPFLALNFKDLVKTNYNKRKTNFAKEKADFKLKPADIFAELAKQNFQWDFRKEDLENPDDINTIDLPTRSLCNGYIQEIIWDMLKDPGSVFFLKNPQANSNNPGLWSDEAKVAIGNTSTEALAALIKGEIAPAGADDELLSNVEFLMDALQSGWLNRLKKNNGLFQLEELLHSQGFTRDSGGKLWTVKQKQQDLLQSKKPQDLKRAVQEITLPPDLAHDLHLLNQAQKAYDRQRGKLEIMTRQIFMDWVRYLKVNNAASPHVDLANNINDFLYDEMDQITKEQKAAGLLSLSAAHGPDGQMTRLVEPAEKSSQAHRVWQLQQRLTTKLDSLPDLQLHLIPAPDFYSPNDPVIVIEGKRIEPVARNGTTRYMPCRLSNELIAQLKIDYQGQAISLENKGLSRLSLSKLPADISQDATKLIQEAFLLIPMLADALKGKLPAANAANILVELKKAQGGWNAIEKQTGTGLFEMIRTSGYLSNPKPNVKIGSITFTNALGKGWAPDPAAWSTRKAYPDFYDKRQDPFLPLFLQWKVTFDPLKWKTPVTMDYDAENLKDYFSLDTESIDYRKETAKSISGKFTIGQPITYHGSVYLSHSITKSLVNQIDTYLQTYPNDPTLNELEKIKARFQKRKIMSQGLSGFNDQMVQMEKTLKVKIRNLLQEDQDQTTEDLETAATTVSNDSWYDLNFNSYMPVEAGVAAEKNFSALRAGLLDLVELKIVDVFGQPMDLYSTGQKAILPADVEVASSLKPPENDKANADKVFLPPRLQMPARLLFRWLSAAHENPAGASDEDCVEMNDHPATSPICGWVMPNHLDNSLFFYEAVSGKLIGSFGIEHGTVTYRSRPSNIKDNLEADIGQEANPSINPHLAHFMRLINKNDQDFLNGLMGTIEHSHQFINPERVRENTELAVLVGRPLALTRAALSLETKGGQVPIKQAFSGFKNDVNKKQQPIKYEDRVAINSGNIQAVQFPVRLGNLTKITDGLVGYCIDTPSGYEQDTFFSPAAEGSLMPKIKAADFDTLQLTLNAPPKILTMLVDPRAVIHATTGILPVQQLSIPADQFVDSMRNLTMTFFTHPVLQRAIRSDNNGLAIPLPKEDGYQWSWVGLKEDGNPENQKTTNQPIDEQAFFSYSPQSILEGWLELELIKKP